MKALISLTKFMILISFNIQLAGIAEGDIDVIFTLCAAIKRRKGVAFHRWNKFEHGEIDDDGVDYFCFFVSVFFYCGFYFKILQFPIPMLLLTI